MRPEDSLKATPDMQFWLEGLQFESQFRQTNRFLQKPLGQEDPHISSLNVATRQNSSSSPGYCSEVTFAFLVSISATYFSYSWGTARSLPRRPRQKETFNSLTAFTIPPSFMYFSTPIILITLLSSIAVAPVGAFFGNVVRSSSGATSYGIYSTKSVTPSSPMMAPNDSDESDVIYSGEVLTEMGGEGLAPYKM